ncbi:hypothetical protein QE152_g10869 [Popillia japonica]|uniref:Uncharacterized protein n=1 Tax=Popillia japonica TaxID=7064 RepID=A0AAW1LTD2_POPJA
MTPPPNAENDLASVGSWFEANVDVLESWLRDHASKDLRQRVQKAILPPTTLSKRTSVTSDLFQLWLAASPAKNEHQSQSQNVRPPHCDLESMGESELFMELIRDVANELDIDVLCHKILKNVSLLTHADRGSLFLARGPPDDRYLVAKLFDVRHDSQLEEVVKQARVEDIKIPFGVGIAGTVAQYKTLINIKDAYNKEVKALKSERVISSAATVDNIDSPIVHSVLQEIAEREKRKSNLVIFNLTELENGSRSDQISEDVSSVRDILANLGVVVEQVHPLRLGKFDPTHQHRKRPIKITLSSSGLVSSALRESSKLKSIDKSIFLTNDKTPLQSSLYKTVKQQLNQRIAAGETNIYIRHFNGTPKIVKRNNLAN